MARKRNKGDNVAMIGEIMNGLLKGYEVYEQGKANEAKGQFAAAKEARSIQTFKTSQHAAQDADVIRHETSVRNRAKEVDRKKAVHRKEGAAYTSAINNGNAALKENNERLKILTIEQGELATSISEMTNSKTGLDAEQSTLLKETEDRLRNVKFQRTNLSNSNQVLNARVTKNIKLLKAHQGPGREAVGKAGQHFDATVEGTTEQYNPREKGSFEANVKDIGLKKQVALNNAKFVTDPELQEEYVQGINATASKALQSLVSKKQQYDQDVSGQQSMDIFTGKKDIDIIAEGGIAKKVRSPQIAALERKQALVEERIATGRDRSSNFYRKSGYSKIQSISDTIKEINKERKLLGLEPYIDPRTEEGEDGADRLKLKEISGYDFD